MKTSLCLAAAACIALLANSPVAVFGASPAWTLKDLDNVALAALAAAPGEREASLRELQLLNLGLAFTKSGDQPAAHGAFDAAARTAKSAQSKSADGFRIQAVPRMAAAGAVEDAESLANSTTDAQLRDELLDAVKQVAKGDPNPFETPRRGADTAPNTDDVDSWLAYAKVLLGKGDTIAARAAALHASQLSLAVDPTTLSTGPRIEHSSLLGRVSGQLADVGAYDEALATVQPIEPINRGQYYLAVVDAAIRAQMLPPSSGYVDHDRGAHRAKLGLGLGPKLRRLVKALGPAGYRDAARDAFVALKTLHDKLTAPGLLHPDPDLVMIAECLALTGDLPGALATAEATGPLVTPPGPGMAVMATVFSYGESKTQPTQAELAARLDEMQKRMPALMPGLHAHALADIVAALAAIGEIDKAIELEPGLEVEPRDVLAQMRDQALAAIAEGQQKAGDLRASLATTLRITQHDWRLARLLALAAVPPR